MVSLLHRLASLFRNLFHRSRVERELDAELVDVVQLLTDEKVRAGMSPEAARRAALVEVGGVEQVKEEVRSVQAGALVETVARDVRFGVRMLLKYPVLSLSVVLTFGLGIGLTTAVFGLLKGIFLTGLPFEGAERIVALGFYDPELGGRFEDAVSLRQFLHLREHQTVFEGLAAYSSGEVNVTVADGGPERHTAGFFSPGAFEQLSVRPVLGRTFRPGEDAPGAAPVVVLGYEMWRDRFAGSADVLGREVRVHGAARTVVGVMPEGFGFPRRERLWLPLPIDGSAAGQWQNRLYPVIGRLREGTSLDEAQAQVATLAARLERPRPGDARAPAVTALRFMDAAHPKGLPAFFAALLGAAAGVLLIASSNVANLLLARASARSHEVAVRAALGASRGRVVTQLVVEVLVLAGAGAVLGLGLAACALGWITSQITAAEGDAQVWMRFGLDARVFLFAAGVTLLAGVASSLVPALRTASADAMGVLKDGGRGTSGLRMGRFSSALIVAEVAVSCVLLVGSGLMIRSMVRLGTADLPFSTRNILTAGIALPRLDYPTEGARASLQERLLQLLAAIPGAEAATLSDNLPGSVDNSTAIEIEGSSYARPSDYPRAQWQVVGPGYFRTFEAAVLRGREFNAGDRRGALPVALANESFARRHFAGQEAVGRRFRPGRGDTTALWLTVVGVVPDMYMQGFGELSGAPDGYYVPLAQSGSSGAVRLALRARGDPMALTSDVRAAIRSLDPSLPLFELRSMESEVRRATWFYRDFGAAFVVFGLAALFLASVGLYGVVSFSATRRAHEMGIRMALGAEGPQLVWLVLRKGAALVVIGLAVGLALAAAVADALGVILFQVDPRDPVVFGGVAASLALVGLAATLIPASRISRVNPVVALGAE